MSQFYTRIFLQILDSSIAENWRVRHVFEDMLKLCDNGLLDMTREAFSRRTNVPLEIVNQAIGILESPDPKSRDQTKEGRRISRLEKHRDWGWIIVNWDKYDKIRCRADAADRQARFRETSPIPPPEDGKKEGEEEVQLDLKEGYAVTQHNKTTLCDCVTVQKAEQIYAEYPRKVAKEYSIRCIVKAVNRHGFEHILERTKMYAKSRNGEDQQFTPYPSTWFNQNRYNDDPSTWNHQQNQHNHDRETRDELVKRISRLESRKIGAEGPELEKINTALRSAYEQLESYDFS